jgi:hypothetical protein
MNTNNNDVAKATSLQLAKVNAIPESNLKAIEPKLSNYGGEEIPVTVTFHQEFRTEIKETGVMKVPEIATDESGEPILEPLTKKLSNGKTVTVYVPKETGKQIDKRVRFSIGEFRDELRMKEFPFLCSNAADLRYEVGQAFNELRDANLQIFKKSEILHMSFTFGTGKNALLLSTKYLLNGGVKLSSIYTKGKFDKEKFADNLCRPLFTQLKKVANGEAGKAIDIDTEILASVGLIEKK